MKYLNALVFIIFITFILSPYFSLYKLQAAVTKNDKVAFEELIDIESIRKIDKENIAWQIKHNVGSQTDIMSEFMRQGAQVFGNAAVDTIIDSNGIFTRLRQIAPLWEQVTFAFFESPTRFMIRMGQFGHNPLHIQMTLQDWTWRITAIYG